MALRATAAVGTHPLADGTRTRLLDSAGEVFAEVGFQAATIRQICARAGVNAALVNYHFGDKLELYTEVLRHSLGSPDAERAALESGKPPEEAFRDLVRASMARIYREGRPSWHFRLMVHEMAQPTPMLSRVIKDTMRPVHDRTCAVVGELLGLPADHDRTRLCAHSVLAQVVHYAKTRDVIGQLWPGFEMTPERIEQISAHIADFSLAYLRQTPPAEAAAPTVSKHRNPRRDK